MIFNALVNAVTVRQSPESKVIFVAGKPSPFKFSRTSRMRNRQLTNSY